MDSCSDEPLPHRNAQTVSPLKAPGKTDGERQKKDKKTKTFGKANGERPKIKTKRQKDKNGERPKI